MSLDENWKKWKQTQTPEDFDTLMDAANPLISSAITSYAPGSAPAVRSKARVLVAKAFNTYDPARKVKLNTHLYNQLQPLYREGGTYSSVHTPERVTLDLKAMKRGFSELEDTLGREPSDREISDHTGMSSKRLKKLRSYDKPQMMESFFEPAEGSDQDSNLPATEKMANLWEDYAYHSMSSPDQAIYDMKMGRNGRKAMSVTAIAKSMKISSGAVSQRLGRISKILQEAQQMSGELDE